MDNKRLRDIDGRLDRIEDQLNRIERMLRDKDQVTVVDKKNVASFMELYMADIKAGKVTY